jgi:hypothetical protein
MADDNDFSIGPGGDDDDDDVVVGSPRAEGARTPPPAIVRLDGGAPPAPAVPPADGPAAPAITPKAATPAAPAAPATRPAAPGATRLVSDAPASAPSPAPAKDTPSAIPSTDALAAQLASLQESIASLTARVEPKATPPASAATAAETPTADAVDSETELDPEAVARDLETFAKKDRDCVQWSEEHDRNLVRLNQIANAKGDGEFQVLDRSIQVLEAQLDPKKFGIKAEPPDDMTAADLESQLETKKARAERLRLEHTRLATRNETLDTKFNEKIDRAEAQIKARFQTQAQQKKAVTDRASAVSDGEREWNAAFKSEVLDKYDGLTDEKGKPNADALFLFNRLNDRAYALTRQDPNLDFAKFIRENVNDEILVLNARRGKANTEAARTKVADVTVPAPRGAAAVAEVARPLSEITDPRERRRQVDRMVANASKRLTLQRTG